MSAELRRRVQMESNRNIDGDSKRYVVTLEQRGTERSASSSVTTTPSGYHRGPSYASATTWSTTS